MLQVFGVRCLVLQQVHGRHLPVSAASSLRSWNFRTLESFGEGADVRFSWLKTATMRPRLSGPSSQTQQGEMFNPLTFPLSCQLIGRAVNSPFCYVQVQHPEIGIFCVFLSSAWFHLLISVQLISVLQHVLWNIRTVKVLTLVPPNNTFKDKWWRLHFAFLYEFWHQTSPVSRPLFQPCHWYQTWKNLEKHVPLKSAVWYFCQNGSIWPPNIFLWSISEASEYIDVASGHG